MLWGSSDGKEAACNAGNLGLVPGLGRPPGEGNGNPLQYSCLENPMDRGALTDQLPSKVVLSFTFPPAGHSEFLFVCILLAFEFFLFFCFCPACILLVPRPGTEPGASEVKVLGP